MRVLQYFEIPLIGFGLEAAKQFSCLLVELIF